MRYTPLYNSKVLFSKADIDRLFHVNRRLLDVTLRGITQEQPDSIPQPRIIIGAEGAGKSWIIMAIRDLLKEVYKDFCPFYFDASGIGSLPEFLSITNDVEEGKGRTVLLADNIDVFFTQLSRQDQYILRSRLNTNGAPILICTATTTPKALTDYSSAFFDGFDIQYIDKLTYDAVHSILGIANDKQKQRVDKLIDVTGTEIKNVMLVKNILSMSSTSNTDMEILFDFIHDATLLRLKSLPQISQQIIENLALSETNKTLAEIREGIGIESYKLSPYITQLVSQGIISKQEESVRKSRYILVDNKLRFFLSYTHK